MTNSAERSACCEWCGKTFVARNRNKVVKRYCGRVCKAAFQGAAVQCVRLLLKGGVVSLKVLRATHSDGNR